MNPVTETLLFPYRKNMLESPVSGTRLLFLNAENPELVKGFSVVPVQPRYDKSAPFIHAGFEVQAAENVDAKSFDAVWILPGKDIAETQYLLAEALRCAKTDGTIVAAAANDAGGKRLEGLFEKLGLSAEAESKNKARVVFTTVPAGYNKEQVELWLNNGMEQPILDGAFLSRSGLHGWDRPDEGSALLVRHLPPDIKGEVADFGCGWGYLSLQAASLSQNITHLTLIDIDARAVSLAERNIKKHHPGLSVSTVWTDLTVKDDRLKTFDVILLNPPFHDGTRAVPALGQAIIRTAAQSLKPSGRLFLVANRHLPYEKTLQELFSKVDMLIEEKGFKVFACTA